MSSRSSLRRRFHRATWAASRRYAKRRVHKAAYRTGNGALRALLRALRL